MTQPDFRYIGRPHPLRDGAEKVTGHVQFVADLRLPGMLHGHVVLSPYAHARITGIDKRDAEAQPGVVAVLTDDDLPSRRHPITSRNSAVLARGTVLWAGQPVAIVVAESARQAADAAELLWIDYEPLPAVTDMHAALRPDAPQVWPNGLPTGDESLTNLHAETVAGAAGSAESRFNNVYDETHYRRGDVAAGFAAADLVVEKTYRTAMLHQMYLEPHACVVDPDPLGRGATVYTSTQGAFFVREDVAEIVGLPLSRVRVVPLAVGGGFGAKYGILEPLVAAVALAVGRPVSVVLSRSADFLSTTPAPGVELRLKTGVTTDGRLTALTAQVFIDNGIFAFGHGGIIANLLGGYYKWPAFQIDCYEVHTHKQAIGAYRAPGAPQATFALESQMDDMAAQLGLDRLRFRLDNAAETGDPQGNGKPWPSLGIKACLQAVADHPLWRAAGLGPDEGIGLAVGGWPTFVTPSEAVCRLDSDGTVRLETGHVDVSGNSSTFALIAAEILGVAPDRVHWRQADTDGPFAPNSGGSQVTYSVAGAVRQAAESAREKLLQLAADELEAAAEDIELRDGLAFVRGVPDRPLTLAHLAERARSRRGGPGPIVGEGRSAVRQSAPAFSVHLVKVRVDRATGRVQPLAYVLAQDVGFALNPTLVTGQIHGGAVQGIGMGLHEVLTFDEAGTLLTGSLLDYAVPRMADTPPLDVLLVENRSPLGPFGARGVGEPPITGGAAALANAIHQAVGVRLTTLPMTAERVWQALQ